MYLLVKVLVCLALGLDTTLRCSQSLDSPHFGVILSTFSLLAFTLWTTCELGVGMLDYYLPWLKAPRLRLAVSVLLIGLLTLLVVTGIKGTIITVLDAQELRKIFTLSMLESYLPTFMIAVFITTFMSAKGFFREWKTAVQVAEKHKREALSVRYETLKSQVSPHFLFNSLNVLTALVHKDPDLAEKFIRQLSNVYRYLLDVKDESLVPLRREMEGLKAYIFLLEIRFGDNFQVKIELTEQNEVLVVPLALQMLLENAVKHNEISREHPLHVSLYQEAGHLVMRNNLNPRTRPAESSGIGLPNIDERYRFLCERPIVIEHTADFFTVKLPIITE